MERKEGLDFSVLRRDVLEWERLGRGPASVGERGVLRDRRSKSTSGSCSAERSSCARGTTLGYERTCE